MLSKPISKSGYSDVGVAAGFGDDGIKEIEKAANLAMDLTILNYSKDEIEQAKNSIEWLDREEELELKLCSLEILQKIVDTNNLDALMAKFESSEYTSTDVACAIARSNIATEQKDSLVDTLKNYDMEVEYSKAAAQFMSLSKNIEYYYITISEHQKTLLDIYLEWSTNYSRRKEILAELLSPNFNYSFICSILEAFSKQGIDIKDLFVKSIVKQITNSLENSDINNNDFQFELEAAAKKLLSYAIDYDDEIYQAFVDEFENSDLPDDEIDFIVDTVWEHLSEELSIYEMISQGNVDGLVDFINKAKTKEGILAIRECELIAKCLINCSATPTERDAVLKALESKGHDLSHIVARLLSEKFTNSMTADVMLSELIKHTNDTKLITLAIWRFLENKMAIEDIGESVTKYAEEFIVLLEGKGLDISYLKQKLATNKILVAIEAKQTEQIDNILNECRDYKQEVILDITRLLDTEDLNILLVILKHANATTQQILLADPFSSFSLANIIVRGEYSKVKPILKDGVLEQVIAPLGNEYRQTALAACIKNGVMEPFLDLSDDAKKEVLKNRMYKDQQMYSPVVNAIQSGLPSTQSVILQQFGKEGIFGLFESTGLHPLDIGGVDYKVGLFGAIFAILGDDPRKQDLIKGSNKVNVLANIVKYNRDSSQIRCLTKTLFEHANPETRKHLIFHTYDALDIVNHKNTSFFGWISQERLGSFLMISEHVVGFESLCNALKSHMLKINNDLTSTAQFEGEKIISSNVNICMKWLCSIVNDGYAKHVQERSSELGYNV